MNKGLKITTSAALLAGVVAPVAVSSVDAAASTASISSLTVPTVKATTAQTTGVVKIVVPGGARTSGETLILDLGDAKIAGFSTVGAANVGTVGTTQSPSGVTTQPTVDLQLNEDSTFTASTDVSVSAEEKKVKIQFNTDVAYTSEAVLYVELKNLDMTDVASGEYKVKLSASPNSGLPTGDVTVANVFGEDEDKVTVTSGSLDTHNSTFEFKLGFKEDSLKSIKAGDYVKVKLPAGYKWTTASNSSIGFSKVYGDTFTTSQFTVTPESDERVLKIEFTTDTTVSSNFEISNLRFLVDDQDLAKNGEIIADIDAEGFDIGVSEIKVGTYGQFGTTISAKDDEKVVVSGQTDQKVNDITIKESIKESLVAGRTVVIELPDGVKFTDVDTNTITDNGVTLNGNTSISSAKDKLTLTVSGQSSKAAELKIKGLKVSAKAGFTGDVIAKISGTAGVEGEVKIAEAKPAVTATVEKANDVIIGLGAQKVADIEITESVKEAFLNTTSGTVQLVLPEGVHFEKLPTLEVDGDLDLDDVNWGSDKSTVTFDVDAQSIKASKITVKDVSLRVYRDVPEGNIELSIKGGDLVNNTADFTANDDTAAKVVIARVATPAEGKGLAGEVVFTVGATTYVANGVEKTMDVAPFIEGGRSYMPIRYVAEAVGADFITWDQATQTATIMKGDRVVQLTAGSKALKVNGASISMDAAAQVKEGRTVLPVRFVGQALGANVDWNEADQTVTVK
ncbi:copper amine oxidase N-terminal domain-containing protein [Bacillus sp. Marseille-P3661]|uniref:copper amine oxidase N-terminal domain-containing protein n=1 Tax=Bacillus sp. Marseille-P3661 TaxID=1936234 RepID=UPI000C8152D2|nr:copper amine oxidase N-terminal domain-containing protein [Bacillus sp. Marseille-P3661]